jgi:DNA-binding YbaB/EbfC family protein
MFDKIKGLMDMQKKMQDIKRELDNASFEIQSSDGLVKITMNGSQEVKEVRIAADIAEDQKEKLAKAFKDAFNRSIKRSQELAAQKMKDITGLNLPGM